MDCQCLHSTCHQCACCCLYRSLCAKVDDGRCVNTQINFKFHIVGLNPVVNPWHLEVVEAVVARALAIAHLHLTENAGQARRNELPTVPGPIVKRGGKSSPEPCYTGSMTIQIQTIHPNWIIWKLSELLGASDFQSQCNFFKKSHCQCQVVLDMHENLCWRIINQLIHVNSC